MIAGSEATDEMVKAVSDLLQLIYDQYPEVGILEQKLQQDWEQRHLVSEGLVEASFKAKSRAIAQFVELYKRRQGAH